MQNAARAMITGNRPYTSYSGQRVADYNSGFGQATGIMQGLQTSGPGSYTQTSFSQPVSYNPTAYNRPTFQQGPGYNSVNYTSPTYQQGEAYTPGSAGASYSGAPGGIASYQPQTIAPREFSQAEVDKYMSPYINDVIDASVDRANIQYDRNAAVNRLKDARGGNYGSYGFRVAEAVRDAEHNRNVNELVRTGLEAGYNNATGLMQSWRDAALRGDELTMQDRQFGADRNISDAQFAANFGLQQAQELNRERQFGANMSAQERQQMNDLMARDAQFRAQFESGESQFGANLSAQERQQLNDLMARDAEFAAQFGANENQFGANLTAQQRQQLNELMARENQFGATYGLDARDQWYNQQSGIASYMTDEADRRMRWQQAGLDTDYNTFLEDRNWDRDQISWLTSILYGVPGSVQNNYQNIYSNPLAQGLGGIATLAGLAGQGGD